MRSTNSQPHAMPAMAVILGTLVLSVTSYHGVTPWSHRMSRSSYHELDPRKISGSRRQRPLVYVASTTTSTAEATTTRRRKRRARTVMDRSGQETAALVADLLGTIVQAGPRAGPARTAQAYRAATSVLRDVATGKLPSPFEEAGAPAVLRTAFERMGATYIKLGQFVASSPTLFPAEYVKEFQKCLDATEALPWSTVEKVLKAELGSPLPFSDIDQRPLASASIAQVHKAVLRETGETVAVKIQKPGIDESLKADLGFIYGFSRVVEFLQPDFERTSLSAVASDIKTSMLEELNFELEANNVEDFREFLQDQGLTKLATAPRILRKYTTKRVMTMEFLEGRSLLEDGIVDPERTIATALDVWTRSVLTMPTFHADVHAGNLLQLRDGRIGFLDFGIVGRVSPMVLQAVSELSGALALGDYRAMAEALCKMGATDDDVDLAAFADDLERAITSLSRVQPDVTVGVGVSSDGTVESATVNLDVNEEEVTQVLLDLVRVTEDNGLRLPREFGLLVKQMLYFDRYFKVLAPDVDMMGSVGEGMKSSGPTTTADPPTLEIQEGVIDV